MIKKSAEVNLNKITAANSLDELLGYNGQAFIYACYQTFLHRLPDQSGQDYYSQQLNNGVSKGQIITDIRLSPEGTKQQVNIKGLEALLEIYRIKSKTKSLIQMISNNKKLPRSKAELKDALHAYQTFFKANKFTSPNTSDIQLPKISQDFITDKLSSQTTPVIASGKIGPTRTASRDKPVFWFDLTTSMEWTGDVVDIIQTELEIAWELKKIDPEIRFSMQKGNGFVEIPEKELAWFFNASDVTDAYMKFFNRYKASDSDSILTTKYIKVDLPDPRMLHHPYGVNDVVLSIGWMDSQKEAYFAKVKAAFPNFYLIYMIYDVLILRQETKHFYPQEVKNKYQNYIRWISEYADLTLFPSLTAERDSKELQNCMGWPSSSKAVVKWGANITNAAAYSLNDEILYELGVRGSFILTAGRIEPHKNLDTFCRAYLIALSEHPDKTPQLVICGKPMGFVEDLIESIDRDPKLVGRVLRIDPTPMQLVTLYKHCSYTVIPSIYEGWNTSLYESLAQQKFCLAADTPLLREIGRELIDYVPALDERSWANKIIQYSNDSTLLKQFESRIAKNFKNSTWKEVASSIYKNVVNFTERKKPIKRKPEIWMDLTLSIMHWHGGLQGIIRAELTFARYLNKLAPSTHFFAYDNGYIFEIHKDMLQLLFSDLDLSVSYKLFHEFWQQKEALGEMYRSPVRAANGFPHYTEVLQSFPDNTILFFAAIDWGQVLMNEAAKASREGHSILATQLIYDMTPILVPHFHMPETCQGYQKFLEISAQHFDHIVYGGQTAQRDGTLYQKQQGWRSPDSSYVEFGSDIELSQMSSIDNDYEILERMGIGDNYVMTVGTIQPRKNHVTLYKAYIILLSRGVKNLPKLIIVGKPGWKANDFLTILNADERVKDLIVVVSPTDDELNILYRNCKFTLLPSFYEGWSLTLPESLSAGKFCLTADTAPLRETGRDLVEYVNPYDTYAWADRIEYYISNPQEVLKWESRIQQGWKPRSWEDSTVMLLDLLYRAHEHKVATEYKNINQLT